MEIKLKYNLYELNKRYENLSVEDRIKELYKDFNYEEVLLTSSFAANSAFFLHLFSSVTESKQKVHFIDTTYHFPETLEYKKLLTEKYRLNVVDIRPDEWKNEFTTKDETWKKNADFCCSVNKVEPLNAITSNFNVWASGLMRSQNNHRQGLRIFEEKNGILRFYPIIDVTPEQRDGYILWHKLNFHPLVKEGYSSIGCKHCTVKGAGREGRWVGLAKTECGLHI
ncbi:MAG: phosphoadenylyl-sulfate reductase [Flavobacteriales bacterium]